MVTLRVGLLCHRGVGGSTRIAVDLAEGLAARGHAVHLFARTYPLGRTRFVPGVAFHPLVSGDGHAPPSPHLDTKWSAEDLIRMTQRVVAVGSAHQLDVLHFHYAVPFAWMAAAVRRRLGAQSPVVVGTLHGTDVSGYGVSLAGGALARPLREVDALTTVSRTYVELATRTFFLSRPPEHIPNFVDIGRFRPADTHHHRSGRRPRIVHVSNFRPVKDPAAVARVFLRVWRDLDAELWLVGDGEGMASVRSALERWGLDRDVRFFGLHPAVEAVLPQADVLLLTSRIEAFGLAALEAAACGVPTVGPRIGGLPEVVLDGETGLLYEPGDEEEAASAVRRLLFDHDRRRAMATRAVTRAAGFSSATMVGRYEDLYRRLLER